MSNKRDSGLNAKQQLSFIPKNELIALISFNGNEKATKLSGINTNKVYFIAYTNLGFLSAIAGLITGGAMVFLWKFVISNLGGVFAIYELLPAFVLAIIVNVIVSLCTAKPTDDMIAEFDAVNAELKK